MLVDWGDVTLNHYIPQEILTTPDIDAVALAQVIESMRPAPAVALELPQAPVSYTHLTLPTKA